MTTSFTPFVGQFSVNPNKSLARQPAMYVDNKVLTANTAVTFAPPAGANIAMFNATDNFYAAYTPNGFSTVTAVVPGSSTTNGAGCELNPITMYIGNLAEISIISAGTPIISISYYN